MEAANHFRKSDINMHNIDAFFLQEPMAPRNSFSINRVPSLDFITSKNNLSHNCFPLQILAPTNKTSQRIESSVKDKLTLIQ